MQYYKGVTI